MTCASEQPAGAEAPKASGRDRRVYVWWALALTLLALLGVFCWAVVLPVWRARSIVPITYISDRPSREPTPGEIHVDEAIRRLGGAARADRSLDLYMRLPARMARDTKRAGLIRARARELLLKRVLTGIPQIATAAEFLDAVWENNVEKARTLAPSVPFREMTPQDLTGERLQYEIVDIKEIDWKATWALYPQGKPPAQAGEVYVPFKCEQMFFGAVDGLWVRNGRVEVRSSAGSQYPREKATRDDIRLILLKQKGKPDQLRFGLLHNWYCP
jgi:hypothetical protein